MRISFLNATGERLAIAVSAVMLCVTVFGTTYHVSAEFGSDDNDGSSMAKAFKTLERFCGSAPKTPFAGCEVVVSNGTYAITNAIYLSKGAKFRSFDGVRGSVVIDAQDKSPVFYMGSGDEYGEIRGLTIARGRLDSDDLPTYRTFGGGAGVCMAGSASSVVSNCTIRNCTVLNGSSAVLKGGGIFCNAGTVCDVEVADCVITNVAGGALAGCGGGVWLQGEGCKIRACRAVGNRAANGGGIAIGAEGSTVENCVVEGNAAKFGGGLYYGSDGSSKFVGATLSETIVRNNSADSGGGVYFGLAEFCDASITMCAFEGNVAVSSAGGAIRSSGMHGGSIRDSVFVGNSATIGAMIYSYEESGKVDATRPVNWKVLNCLFRKNVGLGRTQMQLINVPEVNRSVVDHCTFVGNSGGAVFSAKDSLGTATSGSGLCVSASVVCGNTTNFVVDSEALIPNVCYCYSTGIPVGDQHNILVTEHHPLYQFRNYAAGDWRLKAGSQLLNVDSSSACAFDWMSGATDLGNGTYHVASVGVSGVHLEFRQTKPRIVGEYPDVGCFELRVPKGFFVGFD